MSEPRSLFLIDGSNQMYRAYHAIRGLTGPDGRSTNAVYGFVTMLRKLLADHKPTHIVASFDLPTDTFRDKIVADYKANRAPMPSDLAEQIPWVHEACEAMGVPILTSEGFEADDVIGTLAKKAAAAGVQVAIVTGDKDFFQLVDGPIRVYNPKDDGAWFDAEGVKAKFGVAPSQVVDVLALMGDTSDNVKGVPGIGEKGARDLITTFGSLDALLAAAGEVKAKKQREALLAHADDARQARQLVTIHTDVPVPFDAEALTFRGASRERCYTLFSALGFRTLVTDYAPSAESVTKDYAVVESPEAVAALAADIRASGRVALHVLADGDAGMRAEVAGLVFATGAKAARFLPFGAATLMSEAGLDRADTFAALKAVLEDASIAKVGHDLKFATVVLARHGITLAGLDLDTMLAAYLLDASRSSPGSRAAGARAARLSRPPGRRRPRQGREGGVVHLAGARPPARLRGRTRGPGLATRRTLRAGTDDRGRRGGLPRSRTAARADSRRARARRREGRHARAGQPGRAHGTGDGHARRRDLQAGRRDVQHRLAQAARRDPVRQAPAAGAEAHRHDAHAVDGRRGARRAGAHPRSAAAHPRLAQPVEAEGHLHRRAAHAGASGRPGACTPCSTRPWPPPDA